MLDSAQSGGGTAASVALAAHCSCRCRSAMVHYLRTCVCVCVPLRKMTIETESLIASTYDCVESRVVRCRSHGRIFTSLAAGNTLRASANVGDLSNICIDYSGDLVKTKFSRSRKAQWAGARQSRKAKRGKFSAHSFMSMATWLLLLLRTCVLPADQRPAHSRYGREGKCFVPRGYR